MTLAIADAEANHSITIRRAGQSAHRRCGRLGKPFSASTGKRYIGSAYGDQGIWSRWCSYVATGHGGNVELRALVSDPTLDYCRKAFRFALLEYRPSPTPDDVILAREAFWKRILLTRGKYGLNRNLQLPSHVFRLH